jgi:hypothetical protein
VKIDKRLNNPSLAIKMWWLMDFKIVCLTNNFVYPQIDIAKLIRILSTSYLPSIFPQTPINKYSLRVFFCQTQQNSLAAAIGGYCLFNLSNIFGERGGRSFLC